MSDSLVCDTLKRVFLHHIDEFEAHEIKKVLIEENIKERCWKYELFGSLNNQENLTKVMHDIHPLEIINSTSRSYIKKIATCSYMIFNANSSNFEKTCLEMRQVMTLIEDRYKAKPNPTEFFQKKYLILISTSMTWARTFTCDDLMNEPDDDDPNDLILKEEDYRKRKAKTDYCKQKLLERDVIWLQKKCKHLVRSIVVCPGAIYGAENSIFHYIFKLAYYNRIIPIVNSGLQTVPMIYIKDFVTIMKNIIDTFPDPKIRYIFAVEPMQLTLKKFTFNIVKAINEDCSKIRFVKECQLCMFPEDLFSQSVIDMLTLDLKMGLGYLKDFEFHTHDDDFYELLADEYRTARNLKPIKIVVYGPPLVGKTVYSRLLSEYYQIPYIDISSIINIYMKFLEERISNTITLIEILELEMHTADNYKEDQEELDFIEELKLKVKEQAEELLDLSYYYEKNRLTETYEFKVVSRCLIELISTKQFNHNQGYVIDNFPFTYDEAKTIFYNTVYRTKERENKEVVNPEIAISAEEHEIEEEKFKAPLKPTHVIYLDTCDENLYNRAIELTEVEATIRKCLRHQLLPRIDEFRERNDGQTAVENLFYDYDLVPMIINLTSLSEISVIFQNMKTDIGPPFVYPISAAEQKLLDEKLNKKLQEEKDQQNRQRDEFQKQSLLERERKLIEWTKKYGILRKREDEMNDVKTLPIREYLQKYVLPILTDGILRVAEVQPDDPIDFLAEYLFKRNPEGQQAPPFCTPEQRLFFDDVSSESEVFLSQLRASKEKII